MSFAENIYSVNEADGLLDVCVRVEDLLGNATLTVIISTESNNSAEG